MATFMTGPPHLRSFNRMNGDWAFGVLVLTAIVLFCVGVVSIWVDIAQNGRSASEAILWSSLFFLAPAALIVTLVWHHAGAMVVTVVGGFLTVVSLGAVIVGMINGAWAIHGDLEAVPFLLVIAIPALLTGYVYLQRYPGKG